MPTSRPRHMITESDEIAEALDNAALLWPHARNDRGELLRLIIKKGVETVDENAKAVKERKLKALNRLSNAYGGVWPTEWSAERNAEWPA